MKCDIKTATRFILVRDNFHVSAGLQGRRKELVVCLVFILDLEFSLEIMASSSKPQLIKDGPEYSRLSESWDGKRTTWYASGTDPDADEPQPQGSPKTRTQLHNEANNIPMQEDPDSPPRAPEGASSHPPPSNEPELSSDPEEHLQQQGLTGSGGASQDNDGYGTGEREPLVPAAVPTGRQDSREDSGHQSDPEYAETPQARSLPGNVVKCGERFCRCFASGPSFIYSVLLAIIFLGAALLLHKVLIPDLKSSIEEMTEIRPSMSAAFKQPNENISMSIFLYNSTASNGAMYGLDDDVELSDMILKYNVTSVKSGLTWNDNDTVSYRVRDTAVPDYSGNGTDKSEDILATDAQQLATGILTTNKTSKVYNVYTGVKELRRLNQVYTYDYDIPQDARTKDGSWYPGSADGDLFAPFLNKKETLAMFYSQINTNVLLNFHSETKVGDYDVYRYGLQRGAQLNVTDDLFVVSIPSDAIRPGVPVCNQTIDIHQVSGVTLRKSICMEYSIPIPINNTSHMKFVPVVRVYMEYEHTPFYMKQLMSSYHVYHLLMIAMYTCFALSIFFTALALVIILLVADRERKRRSRQG